MINRFLESNDVDEIEITQIELRIGKFQNDGKSTFMVPVKDEKILVEYNASKDKHEITLGKTNVKFKVKIISEDDENINFSVKEF